MLPYLDRKFNLNYFTASNTDNVDDALVSTGFVYFLRKMQRMGDGKMPTSQQINEAGW
jgi:hypothetical protein